jgi:N-acetylmuramoyl-L-alanine amidase
VDGTVDGTASYGSPRPDMATGYPNVPVNIGFSYPLNTTKYSNGPHTVNVRATDSSGNVAVLSNVKVTVSN